MTTDNFSDGRYDPDDKEAVVDALIADAEAAFDHDFSEDEATIIRSFYDPLAERIVELHNGIQDVLNASQLDFAEGQSLDYLGARLGVRRIDGAKASGRAKFSREDETTANRFISAGTIIETDELDPVEFEVDSGTTLALLDDFNDNDLSEYSGDTGDFSTTTTTYEGDYALQSLAVSGSDIYTKDETFGPGSKIHVRAYVKASTIPIFRFAVTDASNCYQVKLDEASGSVELELVDGGTVSDIQTASATIPTTEWLHVIVDWKSWNDIVVTVENAAGDEVASFTGTDSTYDSKLGFGFKSGDANNDKYWDFASMSAVSADVTAVERGTHGNLGANALIVMPNPPTGVESVTNPRPTSGGADEEEDDDYRARIKSELGEGVRGHQAALINQLEAVEGVGSVTVIENDSSSTDADNRPPHSAEPIVQTDSDYFDEVAQTIVETKGTGYPTVGGYAGTAQSADATLPNGQTKTIDFSTPAEVKIYADIDLQVTDEYPGDDKVRDNVVRYIGGILATGRDEDGDLGVGDDVIYTTVMKVIAATDGVYDVTNLEIGTSADPTGTSNISIADTDIATADATDTSLNVATTSV